MLPFCKRTRLDGSFCRLAIGAAIQWAGKCDATGRRDSSYAISTFYFVARLIVPQRVTHTQRGPDS